MLHKVPPFYDSVREAGPLRVMQGGEIYVVEGTLDASSVIPVLCRLPSARFTFSDRTNARVIDEGPRGELVLARASRGRKERAPDEVVAITLETPADLEVFLERLSDQRAGNYYTKTARRLEAEGRYEQRTFHIGDRFQGYRYYLDGVEVDLMDWHRKAVADVPEFFDVEDEFIRPAKPVVFKPAFSKKR
ncbi:MAG: hypothetical protein M0R66_09975 [Candidatus Omnitrophica bacterium]|nr:hypothetical protein [Candidatus Omnitrophota bacterium]